MPRPRTLPTIGTQTPTQALATWKNPLKALVEISPPPPAPVNFRAIQSRGGIQLTWTPVPTPTPKGKIGTSTSKPDGYQIQRSFDGSFVDDLITIPLTDIGQSSYFDSLGGNPKTAFYRIRATSGTKSSPQSTVGPLSGVLKQASLDATDQATIPGTVLDQYTGDNVSSTARLGEYNPPYQSSAPVTSGGSGNPDSVGLTVTFDQIGTGTNDGQTLNVGTGTKLQVTSTGIINANQISGTPVVGTGGTGNVLTIDSNGNATWQSGGGALPFSDHTGETAISPSTDESGTLILCSDASPVGITLTASTYDAGWYAYFVNLGVGLVTLTPSTLIDGLASITLIQYAGCIVEYDGTNFHSVRGKAIVPAVGPTSHLFVNAIASDGTGTLTQPNFTDIGGTLAGGQLPTFTGDVINSAAVMTVDGLQGNAVKTDVVGTITITAGATTASHSFASSYTTKPVVILTPTSDPALAVSYWVTYTGAGPYTAFVANINTLIASNITFNFMIVGNPT